MTTTEIRPAPPATPLNSKPHPGVVRRVLVRFDREAERAFWAAFAVPARYPKVSAGAACLLTAATSVTLREVTGVVVGGAATAGMISLKGSSGRGTNPLAILSRLSTFRRRRRLVRRRWVTVMHDAGLTAASVHAGGVRRRPRHVRISETRYGVRVLVYAANVSKGATDFRAQVRTMRHGFECRDVTVNTHRRFVELNLMWGDDPLLRTIPIAALPAPRRRLHVVVGLDELDRAVEKDMRLPNLLIGAPGAGKSSEIWTTLHALQRAGIPFRLRVFDPKGGMELGALRGHVHRYVKDPSSWDTFLGDAINDMKAREERQEAAGIKEHKPTAAEPLDIMIIDELVTAVLMGGAGSKVKVGKQTLTGEKAFLLFLSSQRAAGFTVIAGAQALEKAVLGPIRDFFPYVSCLRVGTTETTTVDMALGTGAHKVYPAHELDPHTTAGIGWVKTPAGIVRYRAAHLTEGQRAQVVRRMPRVVAS